jgi:hypothetical protein
MKSVIDRLRELIPPPEMERIRVCTKCGTIHQTSANMDDRVVAVADLKLLLEYINASKNIAELRNQLRENPFYGPSTYHVLMAAEEAHSKVLKALEEKTDV